VDGAARSRGSIWFLVLTVITLGWYGFFGAIVIMDAGVSASEAAHLAGAVLCVGLIAAGLLPQLVAPGAERRRLPADSDGRGGGDGGRGDRGQPEQPGRPGRPL
jgi:hypothetical protein